MRDNAATPENARLILLTTEGCHLCDQALALIHQAAPQASIELCDIAEDDQLIARYGELIPVLRCAGRELCWPFSLLDIRQLLGQGSVE